MKNKIHTKTNMSDIEYFIFDIIKNTTINILVFYVFFKIRNEEILKPKKIAILTLLSLVGAVFVLALNNKYNQLYIIIINFFILCIGGKTITESKNKKSIISSMLISSAIVHINYFVVGFLELIIKTTLFPQINESVNLIIVLTILSIVNYFMFKIKRLSKGMQFLKEKINDEYLDIIMINISVSVIYIYTLFALYDIEVLSQITIVFLILSVIMLVMIRKTMTLSYKEKQLAKNLDEDDKIIAKLEEEKEELSKEKFEISKLNHEFEKRIKALELEVRESFNAATNLEIAEENELIDRINNLANEYSNNLEKIKGEDKLDKTEVPEIDNMFKYLQSEAAKEKIKFDLKINCNVNNLIAKAIPKNKLEILIGDLGTDAIIAVKHGKTENKSIITVIGKKDKTYYLSMTDTGIEFEIDTLLELGLKPATTHKDEGGSGIGFITTFETLKETKASLIIEERSEPSENNYTKNIIIEFDGKNEYRIRSYRAEKIIEKRRDNRIIIEKLEK